MARAGLLVAGALMALVGAFFLSIHMHWFPASLLVLGLVTLLAGLLLPLTPAPPGSPASPDLRTRLAELDALRADGILTPDEHRRKREQLLDAWGMPRDGSGR